MSLALDRAEAAIDRMIPQLVPQLVVSAMQEDCTPRVVKRFARRMWGSNAPADDVFPGVWSLPNADAIAAVQRLIKAHRGTQLSYRLRNLKALLVALRYERIWLRAEAETEAVEYVGERT